MKLSLLGLVVATAHLLLTTTTVAATTYGSSNYGSSSTSSGYTTSSSTSSAAYGKNFFAESSNTLYDGYQQAWRYLGWYVDCGNPSGRYNERRNSHASHENQQTYGNMYCQRYLMWAAVRTSLWPLVVVVVILLLLVNEHITRVRRLEPTALDFVNRVDIFCTYIFCTSVLGFSGTHASPRCSYFVSARFLPLWLDAVCGSQLYRGWHW